MARRRIKKRDLPLIALIPDLQNKPGVPLNHVEWIGKYLAEKQPTHIVNIGDHFDFPSLSGYDRGKIEFEGRRYAEDLEAGELANRLLLGRALNLPNFPVTHFTLGNHEDRRNRFVQDHAELDGFMAEDDLNLEAWYDYVHPFLVPVTIKGVTFAHYFYNPKTGKPWGGMIDTIIKNVGFSFVQGHQQGLKWGQLERGNGRIDYGLIAGSAYLHHEQYKGPQANDHWRGIVLLYNVQDGMYDPSFVQLDSLARRYEGMPVRQFLRKTDKHIGV